MALSYSDPRTEEMRDDVVVYETEPALAREEREHSEQWKAYTMAVMRGKGFRV